MAKKNKVMLKITQIRSIIGQKGTHKKTVSALGLRRLNQSVTHKDTPQIRGMVAKVVHLVKMEEIA
jgi:large subunit ribosomal protein L30